MSSGYLTRICTAIARMITVIGGYPLYWGRGPPGWEELGSMPAHYTEGGQAQVYQDGNYTRCHAST